LSADSAARPADSRALETDGTAALRADTAATVVAPGTSCRHQVHDLAGRRALHPLEVLAEQLEDEPEA